MKKNTLKSVMCVCLILFGSVCYADESNDTELTETTGTNLVTNGTFADETGGVPDSWTMAGSYVVTSDGAQTGTNCIKWTSGTVRIEQIVSVEVGATYDFSFYYDDYDATSSNGIKNYTIQGTSGTNYIVGSTITKLPAATTWTKYSQEFKATSNQVKISIRVYQTANIDNVSLVKVSEGSIDYTSVSTIAEMRDLYTNTPTAYVEYTGVATVTYASKANSNLNMFIQDETGAIDVYDSGMKIVTTDFAAGDGITGVKGSFATYNGLLEIVPTEDPTKSDDGPTISAAVKTLSELSTSIEAQLVEIEGVTFSTTGTFAAATSYTITKDGETGTVRTQYSDLPVIGEDIPTDAANVIGIVTQFNSAVQIIPTEIKSATLISDIDSEDIVITEIYSLSGLKKDQFVKGINIVKQTLQDGSVRVKKVFIR